MNGKFCDLVVTIWCKDYFCTGLDVDQFFFSFFSVGEDAVEIRAYHKKKIKQLVVGLCICTVPWITTTYNNNYVVIIQGAVISISVPIFNKFLSFEIKILTFWVNNLGIII